MFNFEQQVSVFLEFRAMAAPVSISVPGHVLHYLEMHAERAFLPDGNVIYRHPDYASRLPAAARAALSI
jgi:hypothetical protein